MTPWYADPDLAPFGASVGVVVGLAIAYIILKLRDEL